MPKLLKRGVGQDGDKDVTGGEANELEEIARGFDSFVATGPVEGSCDNNGRLADFADSIFEPAPIASVEGWVLRDRVAGQECVIGFGGVGGGDEMAAVEAAVCECGAGERVEFVVLAPVFSRGGGLAGCELVGGPEGPLVLGVVADDEGVFLRGGEGAG